MAYRKQLADFLADLPAEQRGMVTPILERGEDFAINYLEGLRQTGAGGISPEMQRVIDELFSKRELRREAYAGAGAARRKKLPIAGLTETIEWERPGGYYLGEELPAVEESLPVGEEFRPVRDPSKAIVRRRRR